MVCIVPRRTERVRHAQRRLRRQFQAENRAAGCWDEGLALVCQRDALGDARRGTR